MKQIGGLLAVTIIGMAFSYLPQAQAAAVSAVAFFIIAAIIIVVADNANGRAEIAPSLGRKFIIES